jgi:Protein of unknown function (DUF1592)
VLDFTSDVPQDPAVFSRPEIGIPFRLDRIPTANQQRRTYEDRSVLDLLTADCTFVNERLATHYGITRQVDLDIAESTPFQMNTKG